MSRHTFDDECPGCRPVLIDPETGKVLADDHPATMQIERVWAGTTLEERQAFHRFTCLNSRATADLQVIQELSRRFQSGDEK